MRTHAIKRIVVCGHQPRQRAASARSFWLLLLDLVPEPVDNSGSAVVEEVLIASGGEAIGIDATAYRPSALADLGFGALVSEPTAHTIAID